MRLCTKLVVVMLVAAVVPLVALNLFLHSLVSSTFYQLIEGRLAGEADLQQHRVETFVEQRFDLLRQVSSRTQLRVSLSKYLDGDREESLGRIETILIDAQRANEEFLSMALLAPDGEVIVSTSGAAFSHQAMEESLHRSRREGQSITLNDSTTGDELQFLLSAPLYLEQRFLGVVAIISSGEQLRSLAIDYAGLDQRGEIQIGVPRGDGSVLLLTSSRTGTTYDLRVVELNHTQEPIRLAFAGKEQVEYDVEARDGTPRIVAARKCQAIAWGVVAMLDQKEVLAPLQRLRTLGIATSFVAGLAVLGFSLLIARSTTAPLESLRKHAKQVTESGDFSKRVTQRSNDEIGELCFAFNEMMEEIHRRDLAISAANRELEEANRDLQTSNQELNDFAYIASHDLKEPLRGIMYYCDFIREDYSAALGEEGNRQLSVLQKLAGRMQRLIESLLKYSRVGRAELQTKPTDLNVTLEEACETLQVLIAETGTQIERKCMLPTVNCDPVLAHEVFTNLISNGIKYNKSAPRKIVVDWQGDAHPQISISDNGIGIPQKHFERIFTIFKRLHANESYDGGSGVGLAIVQKVIQRHGGRIDLESTVGQGTTFRFTFQADADEVI